MRPTTTPINWSQTRVHPDIMNNKYEANGIHTGALPGNQTRTNIEKFISQIGPTENQTLDAFIQVLQCKPSGHSGCHYFSCIPVIACDYVFTTVLLMVKKKYCFLSTRLAKV